MRATLALTTVSVGAIVYTHSPAVWPLLVGEMAGIFLTPDLDAVTREMNGHNYSTWLIRHFFSRWGRHFGNAIEYVWTTFWYPYSFIPHRSWLSHAPVVGTLGRMMYLSSIPVAVIWVMQGDLKSVTQVLQSTPFILFTLGLMASDSLHFAMDMVQTKVKRMT